MKRLVWILCPRCKNGIIDNKDEPMYPSFEIVPEFSYISGTVLTGQHRCYVCNGYGKIAQKASKKKMPSNVVCY